MSESATPPVGTYLRTEFLRYKAKGLWVIAGALLYVSIYYYLVPNFISQLLQAVGTLQLSRALTLTISVMTTHHLSYVIHCAILRVVTYFGWSDEYRCNPSAVWPWQNDEKLIQRTYRTLLFNFFVIIPVMIYGGMVSGQFNFPGDANIPLPQEMFTQIIFCMCAEDVWSFVFHRINHCRLPYRYVHKKHHEYNVSIGMTAEYAHPVEYLITNIVTTMQAAAVVGPVILGNKMQMITFLTWLCYRIGDTVDQHGAYEFPWSPYSILPFASKR